VSHYFQIEAADNVAHRPPLAIRATDVAVVRGERGVRQAAEPCRWRAPALADRALAARQWV
jgi:hypothetical protein